MNVKLVDMETWKLKKLKKFMEQTSTNVDIQLIGINIQAHLKHSKSNQLYLTDI